MAEENIIENEILDNPTETAEDVGTPENPDETGRGETGGEGENEQNDMQYGENDSSDTEYSDGSDAETTANGGWTGLQIEYGEGRHREETVEKPQETQNEATGETIKYVRVSRSVTETKQEEALEEALAEPMATPTVEPETMEIADDEEDVRIIMMPVDDSRYDSEIDVPLMAHLATIAILLAAVVTMVVTNKLLRPHRMQIVKTEKAAKVEKVEKTGNVAKTEKTGNVAKTESLKAKTSKSRKIKRASVKPISGTK